MNHCSGEMLGGNDLDPQSSDGSTSQVVNSLVWERAVPSNWRISIDFVVKSPRWDFRGGNPGGGFERIWEVGGDPPPMFCNPHFKFR